MAKAEAGGRARSRSRAQPAPVTTAVPERAASLSPSFDAVAGAAITALFAVVVIWGAANHEPWRDEVVPLSIARQAGSLHALAAPLAFEGHPILWYLLLWCAYHLIGATWVLKAASLGSAIGAVFLLNRSPLPRWLTAIITFSFFPLYQYSVVSRGHSLEMLILFAFCALFPRRRAHPLALALLLAALANTEAFGLIMAVSAAAMILVDRFMRRDDWRNVARDPWILVAAALYVVALALAASVALPNSAHPLTGYQRLEVAGIVAGIGRAVAYPVEHSSGFIALPAPSIWIWAGFVYLVPRLPLLGFAASALIGIEMLFNLVYGPRAPWHIGNVMLVLVATAWLDASDTLSSWRLPTQLARARVWLGRALAVALAALFAAQVPRAIDALRADRQMDYSSNRRLAELVRMDPKLENAVIMGEPDTPLWSVPYYADNRIYLAREGIFRDWGIFVPPRAVDYDLAALLAAARRVREECACPVLITLGWDIQRVGRHVSFGGSKFEERFDVTPAARDEFLAATRPYAQLRGPALTDESYDVHVLR